MAFYAGQIIKHPAMENPTLLIITDRNDLDDQLFGTFSMCKDLLRQTPQQADSREDLRKLLDCPSGGVIFTTILTNRKNVVVIADEAHRSQYELNSKLNRSTGEIAYGFAKYLRDALPNASFMPAAKPLATFTCFSLMVMPSTTAPHSRASHSERSHSILGACGDYCTS